MTATGTVVRATEEEHSELLWALRGGGVRLGVLLDLELGLRPVGPAVLGGVLAWPRTRAGAVVRTYRDLMTEAPDALGGGVRLRGGRVEIVVLFTGAPARGTAHLAALRALAPALDTVRERPYADLQALPAPEAARAVVLDALGDAVIDALPRPTSRSCSPRSAAPSRALRRPQRRRATAWARGRCTAPWTSRRGRACAARSRANRAPPRALGSGRTLRGLEPGRAHGARRNLRS